MHLSENAVWSREATGVCVAMIRYDFLVARASTLIGKSPLLLSKIALSKVDREKLKGDKSYIYIYGECELGVLTAV